MHKTKSPKTDSSTYSKSLALNSHPQLTHRPFSSEIQKASVAAKTPTDIENEGFAEQQMEATGLSIQAKYGTITSEGQERLTVLQAKMDGLLNSRLEHATRFGHNIANIPLRRPQISTPIQAKLTIGEPGDKYEQEADETARLVVQRIHQSQGEKVQRESLPQEEEELQMKLESSIQRESLPAEEDELQMKPMVQRVADEGMATSPDLETSITKAQENQFEGRGFAVQKKSDTHTQKTDLNTLLLQAKSFGHSISKLAVQESSSASPQTSGLRIQAKLSIGEPGDHYGQFLAMADNYSSEQQPIQMSKNKNEPISVRKPEHNQEQIQDEMIKLWKSNPINEQDQLRADYAWNYRKTEGGWCDGWSYVLSRGADDLADLWAEIDNLLDSGDPLNSTSIYNATTFARKACLYHIMNHDAPADNEDNPTQYADYQAANFSLEQKPSDRENWKHDDSGTLPMYIIVNEIKSLQVGQTLRLTSPIHDAAVKHTKEGYIVSETESHGVQKCQKLEEALLILEEWQAECERKHAPFFNQTLIV
ncbi:MAG: hypothetical protein V7K67_26985 [Nostoc sp.]|uniref:hypothetical protein n=1 Tax=Nostoc sp. TaxID=1180 RepID=UPI002FFAF25C